MMAIQIGRWPYKSGAQGSFSEPATERCSKRVKEWTSCQLRGKQRHDLPSTRQKRAGGRLAGDGKLGLTRRQWLRREGLHQAKRQIMTPTASTALVLQGGGSGENQIQTRASRFWRGEFLHVWCRRRWRRVDAALYLALLRGQWEPPISNVLSDGLRAARCAVARQHLARGRVHETNALGAGLDWLRGGWCERRISLRCPLML
mmetsp:Transcript_22047/g.51688  ORF Transcript_22047/g.51688 Transcript_22047/m.51688 type:complete len:203 (-) Transcript_22047:417-1025(-)